MRIIKLLIFLQLEFIYVVPIFIKKKMKKYVKFNYIFLVRCEIIYFFKLRKIM
jgi:hypothetical protein